MHGFKAEYAAVCCTGRLRRNNEDNFCCDGHIREDVSSAADAVCGGTVRASDNALFAVFDGMGGEACGEVASYIAARGSADYVSSAPQGEYIYALSLMLNEKIREETESRSLVLMGTTAAMLQLSDDTVYILNAGDSRIYKLSRHELRQISKEHIAVEHRGRALTKFLGLPEGHELDPYIARGGCQSGDIFLLCTDGVTDMLTDEEIRCLIDVRGELSQTARRLVDAALEKGGIDNITAVLIRVK